MFTWCSFYYSGLTNTLRPRQMEAISQTFSNAFSSLYSEPTLTRLRALLYIACTRRTIHSSTPTFLIAHHKTFRGTRSNAFSRSTKAKNRVRFLSLRSFLDTRALFSAHYSLSLCLRLYLEILGWGCPGSCSLQMISWSLLLLLRNVLNVSRRGRRDWNPRLFM